MIERKRLLSIFSGLIFLTATISALGAAAPAKKPVAGNEFPVTGKEWVEWAQKKGMDWGPKYFPIGFNGDVVSELIYFQRGESLIKISQSGNNVPFSNLLSAPNKGVLVEES
jgi:hypothetical protein